MHHCRRVVLFTLAAAALLALLPGFSGAALAQLIEDRADVRLTVRIDFPGLGIQDTCCLWGPIDLRSTLPYPSVLFPPHLEVDTEVDTCNLRNHTGLRMKKSGEWPPSRAKGFLLKPEPTVESFFDISWKLERPPATPNETLLTHETVRMTGFAHNWPPLFDEFKTAPEMPPIPLFNTRDSLTAFIVSMEMELVPHYEPEVHLAVPTAYLSNVAVIGGDGLVTMSACLAGDYEATEAMFGYRLCGDPGPFTVFDIDMDGSAPVYSTVNAAGSGDGWSGHFDPGSDPFEGGQCLQFEGALLVPPYGFIRDTVEVWVETPPPIPVFCDIHRDSIAYLQPDTVFAITFQFAKTLPLPGLAELSVFPLVPDFERTLTPVDQLGLGTDLDTASCGPAAGASCLKYFADNGYPALEHANGDLSNPELSGGEIARELQGAMGTNDDKGTTDDGMVAGFKSYLKERGQSGWAVESGVVEDATDLAEMIRELESDGEDVIVGLQDITSDGETLGHWVTLGSVHATYEETEEPEDSVGSPEIRIDFMDPEGGGSQEENNYPLDLSGGGSPTTTGYDLDGEGEDAAVVAYVKVSPPESAPPAPPAGGPLAAAARAPWIPVSSGPVRGGGLVDTLHWDTTPFAGGLYLMEIVTMDDQGFQCRDIRFAGIPVYATGDDGEAPGIKTMLKGSYPNPFNPATTIELVLAARTRVTLAIYDVSGRRVRTLVGGRMTEAGVYRIDWDGRSDAGLRLASGVYFARFVAEGQTSARKLVMLR